MKKLVRVKKNFKKIRSPIIALAQIKYYTKNKTDNLEKIIKYIRLAKKSRADIVCFPESCLHKNKVSLNHQIIIRIQEECKKNSIWCIITNDIERRGKVYNTSLLIDRTGEIKGSYDKIHLYGDETLAGNKTKVFETDFAKIGIVICWDLAFPKLFKKMAKKGAQIIFCPSRWWYESKAHDSEHKEREAEILEALALSRAFENICYVAVCNPVMDSKYQVSYSSIVAPHKVLTKIVDKEGLIIAKINLNDLKKFHKLYDDPNSK